MASPTKLQLETLPQWAQTYIATLKKQRGEAHNHVRLAGLERDKAQLAERNIQLELDRARRRIRELESR